MAVTVRPLREEDLPEADSIFRCAFGTAFGLDRPEEAFGDREVVRGRWRADPASALGAFAGDDLVGGNFVTRWGSVGYFGPLFVRPDLWNSGIARCLIEAALGRFAAWRVEHAGLFTFAQSTKHVALYQKFDFWPRFLTALAAKPILPWEAPDRRTTLGALAPAERDRAIERCRTLTGTIYPGLDLTRELRAVLDHRLGDVIVIETDPGAANLPGAEGLAVCHLGPGTEAGGDTCYVKFGGVAPGPGAAGRFDRLLDACEALAAARGLGRLVAGVNTGCLDAYRRLLARGFRAEMQGVAMYRAGRPGYHVPDAYILDDWR